MESGKSGGVPDFWMQGLGPDGSSPGPEGLGGPWSAASISQRGWLAPGNHQDHSVGCGRGRPDEEERAGGGERKEGWEAE